MGDLDLGGWLSAAALWGASTLQPMDRSSARQGVRWRTLGISVGATLATAPITAAALGTVALAGLVLNFVAIPLAAVAVPGVLASLLIYPVSPAVARAFAGGGGLRAALLELARHRRGGDSRWSHAVEPADVRSARPWVAVLGLALWVMAVPNTIGEARGGWVGLLRQSYG